MAGRAAASGASTAFPVSSACAILGMIVGSYWGAAEKESLINKFHVILNTPIGQEQRLIDAGVDLPGIDYPDGHVKEEDESKIASLYQSDSEDKVFGSDSNIEIRREKTLPWYFPGFIRITIACFALILITWGVLQLLF